MQIHKIITGSKAFFCNYEDFNPHDTDYLIVYDIIGTLKDMRNESLNGEDNFIFPILKQEELIGFINGTNDCNAIAIACILTPEFSKLQKFTIEHLKECLSTRNRLKRKHLYLGIIYDSYIENNGFFLTDEQRLKAYNEYKKYRQ